MFDLQAMRRELAALDARRGPLVALIAAAESYEASVDGAAPARAVIPLAVARAAHAARIRLPRKGPVTMQTVDLVLEMTSVFEAPVTTAEVVAEMRQRGIALPDKNPGNVVSARLSNSDLLEGKRGLGWWPKGKPWPGESGFQTSFDPQIGHEDGGADVSSTA